MASDLNVLFAVSEFAGIVKTGGLADVASALAQQMRSVGKDVRVVMPAYRKAMRLLSTKVVAAGFVRISHSFSAGYAIREGEFNGVPIYLIEHNDFFDREDLYAYRGQGYGDNPERFAFFCAAALQSCEILGFKPDIIHGHDWQSSFLPLYLKTLQKRNPFFDNTKTVLTIHNGAYQEHVYAGKRGTLGVVDEFYHCNGFEDNGQINLLKGGIALADKVTTVSPTYAQEMTTELGSHGLAFIINQRKDDFVGILNGCDYDCWDPSVDELLPAKYTTNDLQGKLICKLSLQEHLGLPVNSEIPVYGLVSRLTEQKGFSYLVLALWQFLHNDVQVVVQGSGDPMISGALRQLAAVFKDKCRFVEAYDERLAHLIEAGSDFFLMPSLFEPCGLNQMYSLKYGTLPIVREVGGLVDTVTSYRAENENVGNGFSFQQPNVSDLMASLNETLTVYYNKPVMAQLINNAMNASFTWEQSTLDYLGVYQSAL